MTSQDQSLGDEFNKKNVLRQSRPPGHHEVYTMIVAYNGGQNKLEHNTYFKFFDFASLCNEIISLNTTQISLLVGMV